MKTLDPDFTKLVDIKAFFFNDLGACGCSEIENMIEVIRDLLIWVDSSYHRNFRTLFNGNIGIYYLLVGMLDSADLCEHGGSIRFPFLTIKGKELLKALQAFTVETIANSEGEAYDYRDYSN